MWSSVLATCLCNCHFVFQHSSTGWYAVNRHIFRHCNFITTIIVIALPLDSYCIILSLSGSSLLQQWDYCRLVLCSHISSTWDSLCEHIAFNYHIFCTPSILSELTTECKQTITMVPLRPIVITPDLGLDTHPVSTWHLITEFSAYPPVHQRWQQNANKRSLWWFLASSPGIPPPLLPAYPAPEQGQHPSVFSPLLDECLVRRAFAVCRRMLW